MQNAELQWHYVFGRWSLMMITQCNDVLVEIFEECEVEMGF